jgi:S1-C subfamily serine protease
MASSPGGVKLQGVRSGSPAEVAGIKGGDILVKIGPDDVKDLYAMTAALQKYRPGDVVDIVIKRGEDLLTLKATLGRRGG